MRPLKQFLKKLLGRPEAPPERRNKPLWQIGIFSGSSPLTLAPDPGIPNPVITRESVTDVPCAFVADPFLVRSGNEWLLFFELLNRNTHLGEIGLSRSPDLVHWSYHGVVLAESFHLSYPKVFQWEGTWYLMPETHQAREVRLYVADPFPSRWTHAHTLLTGRQFLDATVFRHAEHWWMFVEASEPIRHDTLRLYHSDHLTSGWVEHPMSPVVEADPEIARPAGSVIHDGERLIRFGQKCKPRYGTGVRAFEITELTTTAYSERPLSSEPVYTGSGSGWNASRMHHVDAHRIAEGQWIAAVDGAAEVTASEIAE